MRKQPNYTNSLIDLTFFDKITLTVNGKTKASYNLKGSRLISSVKGRSRIYFNLNFH